MTTKLQKILNEKNLTQGDFILQVQYKYGLVFTRSYISKVCSGIITNYTVKTALIISDTLGVGLEDIIDTKSKKIMVKETIEKAVIKEGQNSLKREEKERIKQEQRMIRKEERKVERERKMKIQQEIKKIEQERRKEQKKVERERKMKIQQEMLNLKKLEQRKRKIGKERKITKKINREANRHPGDVL